jgi:hypothetical protein
LRQISRPEIRSGISGKRKDLARPESASLRWLVQAFEVPGLDTAEMTGHKTKVCELLNKLNRLVEEKYVSESINAKKRVEI